MGVSDRDESPQARDPLISIGLIVMVFMLVPVLLYSLVPEGPVKEGDVVFATGRHRVPLADPGRYRELGYEGSCVVEPREQLLVLRKFPARADSSLVAKPITMTRRGVPFCPPKAEVILRPHQANLTIDMWSALRDTVANLFAPW